jgi:hypothetical protein
MRKQADAAFSMSLGVFIDDKKRPVHLKIFLYH